jgi:hypothetical protein
LKLTLHINGDNAAFSEDEGGNREFARILRDAADKVGNGYLLASLRDINGNHVGRFDIESEEE